MPLYAEDWLLDLASDLLGNPRPSILNLFCGTNKQGFRIDLNPEVCPDLLVDAHDFSSYFNGETFDVVLADPPYSDREAEELYPIGLPKLNYKRWTSEATKVLNGGGLLIVYHKLLMPNPDPNVYTVVKRVFIGNRTLHVPRVAVYFQKRSQTG
jgi:hypothetical protein